MDKSLHIILQKLIRNSAGRTRFILATTGLSVALFLLLMAVQIQANFHALLNSKNNQDSIANFLVINKVLTDANIGKTTLDDSMVNTIRSQKFTEAVGMLTTSRFKASIESKSSRFPFYTDIAFESAPSEFIDVANKEWNWNEQSPYIPIIIPNMFLDFYNFQFALSQDLPQLTPAIVKMIIFKITVYGPKGAIAMDGKIVGFSDRISSMLVPTEFMQWGNKHFATDSIQNASRLIIKTKDPGNPLLTNFLKENNLTTDADKTRFSKYRKVVDVVVAISGITGVLLLVFALLIFTLFIQLTITSCKEEISLLIILGISPNQLSTFLMRQFFPSNYWIVSIALLMVTICQFFAHHVLAYQQIFLPKFISAYTLGVALFLILLLWAVNKRTIRQFMYPDNLQQS